MERQAEFELISVGAISKERPYGFRFEENDPCLEASFEKRGILCPVLLRPSGDGSAVLVSGHRRLVFARRKSLERVPAAWVREDLSEREFFLLAVYSNWNQNFSELDRMTVLQKAEAVFGFSEEEILEEIFPALGLSPSRGVLEEYRRTAGLAPEIHRLVFQGRLPFRGLSGLRRFSREEQAFLAREVFEKAHLTANQVRLTAEWVFDLRKIKKCSLEALLQAVEFLEIFKPSETDARGRGERFFERVRSLRFPRLTEAESKFRRLQSRLAGEGIQIERPENFEAEGFLLRGRLKNRESLERILRFLETHRSRLESLL